MFVDTIRNAFKTFGFFHGARKILYTSIYKRLTDPVTADRAYAKSSYKYVEQFYRVKRDAGVLGAQPLGGGGMEQTGFAEQSLGLRLGGGLAPSACDFIYWTCWLQGLDAAPPLVKACVDSAKKNSCGNRIVVITYENLNDYVSLPDFIFEKHKRGLIQAAHFTDILRTYLLYTYGGVWFDATVFFTQNIPGELCKEPVFFFRDIFDDKFSPVSNWFIIAAERKNQLLYKQLCVLLEYWRSNNKLIDYFIFHYFLQVLINRDEQCATLFYKMAYRSNQNPHYLQIDLLFSEFDAEMWEKTKNVSFCHKLTYKAPSDETGKGMHTFLTHIIAGET